VDQGAGGQTHSAESDWACPSRGGSSRPSQRRVLLKRMFPPFLGASLLLLLLSQISLAEVIHLLSRVSVPWIALGGLCYVATNVCRAFRFGHLLSSRRGRFPTLLAIAFALSMFNNILPSRGGEVTFVYMMHRDHAVPAGEAAAMLVVARIFDYLTVATLFVVTALTSLSHLSAQTLWIVVAMAFLLLLTMAFLAAIPWLGRRGLGLLERWLSGARISTLTIAGGILRSCKAAANAFEAIHSTRSYALTALWSLLAWLGTFAWFQAFLGGLGMPTAMRDVILGATFAVLSKAIPFITVGGLGAHEAGWTMGFMLVGFDKNTAIASGFAINILTLLASVLFGGLGLLSLALARGQLPDRST